MIFVFALLFLCIGIFLIAMGIKYKKPPEWLLKWQPYSYLKKMGEEESDSYIRGYNFVLGILFVFFAIYIAYLQFARQ